MDQKIYDFLKYFQDLMKKFNEQIQKRNTMKIHFSDIIYYSFFRIGNNYSYDVTNAFLKTDDILSVSKKSLVVSKNKINLDILKSCNTSLLEYTYKDGYRRMVAVDGSYIYLPLEFHKYGYKKSTNGQYCIAMISALFDVEKELPINYLIYESRNEVNALMSQLNLLKEGDIIILDRFYFSYKLLHRLSQLKMGFICRLKKVSKYAKILNKKKWIIIKEKIKGEEFRVKIIQYRIKNKYYYLATSDMKLSENELKYYYWKRWLIEIHFRFAKYNLSLSNINLHTEHSLFFDLYMHQFIFIVISYFENLIRKYLPDNMKVNITLMLCIFTNRMLKYLVYKELNNDNINEMSNICEIIKTEAIPIIKERIYPRRRVSPTSKWCHFGKLYGIN